MENEYYIKVPISLYIKIMFFIKSCEIDDDKRMTKEIMELLDQLTKCSKPVK